MNKNCLFKKIISLMVIAAIVVSCLIVSSASSTSADESYDETGNEIVTYIVRLREDALLESDEAEDLGTDYLSTDDAAEEKDDLMSAQEKVQTSILNKIDPDAEFGFSYTAVINGFSVKTEKCNKTAIEKLRNVESVTLSVSHARVLDEETEGDSSAFTYTADGKNMCCDVQNIDALRSEGIDGKGMVVAVVDNEFQYDHENFATAPESPRLTKADVKEIVDSGSLNYKGGVAGVYKSKKLPYVYDYENQTGDTRSMTACHGTHVAGIIAGNHIDENGETTGVAPQAQLVVMTTENLLTECIIAAFEDACNLGVDVINNSWGSSYADENIFDEIIENVSSAGVMVTFAAGNSERDYNNISDGSVDIIEYSTSGSPADESGVVAVASCSNISSSDSPLTPAYYSSWGTDSSLVLKPDITSDGTGVYSSISSTTSSYMKYNGTSMASPHMAGILALMSEYIQQNYDLTVTERTQYSKDLLMSTANVMRSEDTGLVYSPRLQGSGLADVSGAINASAFFEGDSGLSKVSLYDNLTDTFDLTFKIKNITDHDVTYTGVSIETVTDGYKEEDGEYLVSGSVALDCGNTVLPESVTIPAGSEKEITINVVLEKDWLLENEKIFRYGFYIDGFVFLTGADDGSSSVNMPFMGFYGDWNSAPTLDEPALSENHLTECTYLGYGTENEVFEYGYDEDDFITVDIPKLGYFYDDDGNLYLSGQDYVAVSPNGDGVKDKPVAVVSLLRSASYTRFEFIDSEGNVLDSDTADTGEKFLPCTCDFKLSNRETVPDGKYTIKVSTLHDYAGATEETVSMNLIVDRSAPVISIKDVNTDDITAVTVPITDEFNISLITFSDGNNTRKIFFDGSSSFSGSVDLTGFNLKQTYVTAEDCAGNSSENKLVCDHNYSESTVAPTCTEAGSVTHSCSRCGYIYTDEIPALGHIDADNNGVCENCGEVLDEAKHNDYLLSHAVITVPSSGEIRWKYRARVTASVTELPQGAHLAWYDGDTLVSDNETLTTGNLTSSHAYTVKIVDRDGNVLSTDAQNRTVTVNVNSGFFVKIISFFLRLFKGDVTVLG